MVGPVAGMAIGKALARASLSCRRTWPLVGDPSVAPPVGALRVIGISSSIPSTVGSSAIGTSTVRLVWPSAKATVVETGV